MLEKNKAIVRRWYEEMWNKGNLELIDELIASDVTGHSPIQNVDGVEASKRYVTMSRAAFPDLHFTIEEMIAEGDKVVAVRTLAGTHRGEYLGVAPTGNHVNITGINVFRIADGRIAETSTFVDTLDLMEQLGATPVQR
jgi:steroid delta-isomerase-like uncharacterized protein